VGGVSITDSAGSTRRTDAILVRVGRFFFRYRKFVFSGLSLALLAGLRPMTAFVRAEVDSVVDLVGIGLLAAGQGLRAMVIGFAYIVRGGRDGEVYAEGLVQEGFFAHSRNPLYVGNLLILLGLFMIHGSPVGVLVGMLFFTFAYWTIVLAEESYLRERFGPVYEDYCRRVNRFIPSFSGFSASVRGMRFNWKRVIRKEYGTLFTNLSAALGLLLWERWARPGGPSPQATVVLLSAWAAALVAYIWARRLKKARRLGRD
jgi:protein-S-isoprenylcysteine O-methyltransferase Ste14